MKTVVMLKHKEQGATLGDQLLKTWSKDIVGEV